MKKKLILMAALLSLSIVACSNLIRAPTFPYPSDRVRAVLKEAAIRDCEFAIWYKALNDYCTAMGYCEYYDPIPLGLRPKK